MADPLYEVTFNGVDDYIPDLGIERIGELIAKLPLDGFEMDEERATAKSVTATFRFDEATGNPFGQAEMLARCAKALTIVRTLHANLVAARTALTLTDSGRSEP